MICVPSNGTLRAVVKHRAVSVMGCSAVTEMPDRGRVGSRRGSANTEHKGRSVARCLSYRW